MIRPWQDRPYLSGELVQVGDLFRTQSGAWCRVDYFDAHGYPQQSVLGIVGERTQWNRGRSSYYADPGDGLLVLRAGLLASALFAALRPVSWVRHIGFWLRRFAAAMKARLFVHRFRKSAETSKEPWASVWRAQRDHYDRHG